MLPPIEQRIAALLGARPHQVVAAVLLLDEGATVPFIARYRKEVTGGLDDTQLRTLDEQLGYLRELEERRTAVIASVDEQGKLSPELRQAIENADTKQSLEDLYLPYRQKRRTKAQIARESGLEPLADALLDNPMLNPEAEAEKYLDSVTGKDHGVIDVKNALDGARQILMERFAEDAELLGQVRRHMLAHAVLAASVAEGKEIEGAKFRDYFDYQEAIAAIPSHRALALFRGRNEGMLRLAVKLPEELQDPPRPASCISTIAARYGIAEQGRPGDRWLTETARWAWMVKISLHLELELSNALRERAEEEAIRVFARNLHDLILAAPAGPRTTLGLDPGIRTGVKVAVVDRTGKLLDTTTIYPHEPRRDWSGSLAMLSHLATKHQIDLISIGNGTASRETDKLAAELMQCHPELNMTRVVVSEAGASVYSASELAAKEFPTLDVSLRGAVSIARRLQDPLAELVKIDAKAIGVGQYQHDVNQTRLARSLDAVVEDCVNSVGVDLNTASVPLLTRISGLNGTLATNIVAWRDQHGAFRSRRQLLEVPRLGDKTFEQAAGFLRIQGGDYPLDASAVHPEAYPIVKRILADIGKGIAEIIGDAKALKAVDPAKYTDERFGLPTVRDILAELEKPGRDPRPEFKTATFKDGIEDMKDLVRGMLLEGVVTNVTNFGAFVDIGVHQDGLVHISALANTFVKDPHSIVKAGDVVRVKVMEVDLQRRRVALTMRLDDVTTARESRSSQSPPSPTRSARKAPQAVQKTGGAIAAAFANLKR